MGGGGVISEEDGQQLRYMQYIPHMRTAKLGLPRAIGVS